MTFNDAAFIFDGIGLEFFHERQVSDISTDEVLAF